MIDQGDYQMYNNFSQGIEWYYNRVTGRCLAYGINPWNEWSYGSFQPGQNEIFRAQGQCSSFSQAGDSASSSTTKDVSKASLCNEWTIGEKGQGADGEYDQFFQSTMDHCLPHLYAAPMGRITFYEKTMIQTDIPIQVFIPPAACVLPHSSSPIQEDKQRAVRNFEQFDEYRNKMKTLLYPQF